MQDKIEPDELLTEAAYWLLNLPYRTEEHIEAAACLLHESVMAKRGAVALTAVANGRAAIEVAGRDCYTCGFPIGPNPITHETYTGHTPAFREHGVHWEWSTPDASFRAVSTPLIRATPADDVSRETVAPGPLAKAKTEAWKRRNPDYARRLTDPLLAVASEASGDVSRETSSAPATGSPELWECGMCVWAYAGSSANGMPAEVREHIDSHEQERIDAARDRT